MGAADALVARLQGEAEERTKFMDGLVEAAEKDGRDLTEQEMNLLARARDRLKELGDQVGPLQSAIEIAQTSRERTAAIAKQFEAARGGPDAPKAWEYRSAGAYVLDVWRARMGNQEIAERLDLFNRAAAHQTTGDNPGLLPEQILGPVVNFVDASRPLISALGPRQLPSGSWSRPKVTVHTATAAQVGEKTELTSQKMTIAKLPVAASTYGGYVNVSRQDIDWSQPAIMDLVINDLAGEYAKDTENHACTDLTAAAPAGPVIPTGVPTADEVAAALWGAASTVIPAVGGQGRIIAVAPPELMAILGPLFPPVGPSNAQSAGFSVAAMASGLAGSIAGIPVYVSNGMSAVAGASTILVLSTAAAEVYEDRIGSLQVVEPSVLGVQVAYAGYFAELVVEAAGMSKIVKTP